MLLVVHASSFPQDLGKQGQIFKVWEGKDCIYLALLWCFPENKT